MLHNLNSNSYLYENNIHNQFVIETNEAITQLNPEAGQLSDP